MLYNLLSAENAYIGLTDMSVEDCSSGMQYEGRVTKGNASQALASLVNTIQSVEGFSPQQRVTVSIKRCSSYLEAEIEVACVHDLLSPAAATLSLPVLQSLQCTVVGIYPASSP